MTTQISRIGGGIFVADGDVLEQPAVEVPAPMVDPVAEANKRRRAERAEQVAREQAALAQMSDYREPEPEVDYSNPILAEMSKRFEAAVADIERRLAQTYELKLRQVRADQVGVTSAHSIEGMDVVYPEDIHDGRHRVTGYIVTANSPANGSIAWSSLHVVFMGTDYTIADGTTANKYAWFVKPASGSTATLSTGNTVPSLGPNDALIFVNTVVGGVSTVTSALESSIPAAVQPGIIGDAEVSQLSQSKIAGLATLLGGIGTDIERIESKADGAVTQHFGTAFPWANASVQDAGKTGDVYTVQGAAQGANPGNGTSYRWSGPSGSPANTWILIDDTALTKALADSASALGRVNGKTTAYYRTVAQGAPPAPAEGFTTGDEWVQYDNGNYTQRWTGTAWAASQYGDAALSGIAGTKVGTGINGSNVTSGTVAAARVGAGVAGAVLNSATGTIGAGQIGNAAVTPAKINAAFHLLY